MLLFSPVHPLPFKLAQPDKLTQIPSIASQRQGLLAGKTHIARPTTSRRFDIGSESCGVESTSGSSVVASQDYGTTVVVVVGGIR